VGGGALAVLVGAGDGLLDVGEGLELTGSPCRMSRYVPYLDDDAHSLADSTAVPSPHSLNVVISWNCAPDEAIAATWFDQREGSRVSRGDASPFFQNPGEIVYEYGDMSEDAEAGPY